MSNVKPATRVGAKAVSGRGVVTKGPIPCGDSKLEVQAFAEMAAEKFGFDPGDSIEALVERLGGEIEFFNQTTGKTSIPDSIVVNDFRDFTIYLSSLTSARRDRFTIAHELGHYLLHYPIVAKKHPGARMVATRWVDESDEKLKRAEWEANWFSAAFLMPKVQFKSAFNRYGGAFETIALVFGVSTKAAEVRAESLSLK